MTHRRTRLAVRLVVVAVVAAAVGHAVLRSSPSPAAPRIHVIRGHLDDPLGRAGGAVPDGTTVFDAGVPGVRKLDPALLAALRRASTDGGVELVVDSGWRSRAYQEQLLREAIVKYGSREEAERWVATPNTSAHVSGHAVDLASAGAAWLSQHGAAYGLCQVYANEPWHFELRPAGGCPPMYADPTQDPRMARAR